MIHRWVPTGKQSCGQNNDVWSSRQISDTLVQRFHMQSSAVTDIVQTLVFTPPDNRWNRLQPHDWFMCVRTPSLLWRTLFGYLHYSIMGKKVLQFQKAIVQLFSASPCSVPRSTLSRHKCSSAGLGPWRSFLLWSQGRRWQVWKSPLWETSMEDVTLLWKAAGMNTLHCLKTFPTQWRAESSSTDCALFRCSCDITAGWPKCTLNAMTLIP